MDSPVIRNAIGTLDRMLGGTKETLWAIEYELLQYFGKREEEFDYRAKAFVWQLAELYDVLLVVLEAAQLSHARENLMEAWKSFKTAENGLRSFHIDHD